MRMTPPQVRAEKVCLAKNQPEYTVLTVALVRHPRYPVDEGTGHNSVLMAFRPTAEERARIADGEDIYVSLLTGGHAMQPILVLAGKDAAAHAFDVEVET
jgi:hypothetical protein